MIFDITILDILSLSASTVLSISLQVCAMFFLSVSSTLAIYSFNQFTHCLMHSITTGKIWTRYPGLIFLTSQTSWLYFCKFFLVFILMFWSLEHAMSMIENIWPHVFSRLLFPFSSGIKNPNKCIVFFFVIVLAFISACTNTGLLLQLLFHNSRCHQNF